MIEREYEIWERDRWEKTWKLVEIVVSASRKKVMELPQVKFRRPYVKVCLKKD